jgi:hypothetical protein
MRESFEEGRFRVGSLEGLFSICLYEDDGALEIFELLGKRITVARSYRNEVLSLVKGTSPADNGSDTDSQVSALLAPSVDPVRSAVAKGNQETIASPLYAQSETPDPKAITPVGYNVIVKSPPENAGEKGDHLASTGKINIS